MLQYLQDMVCDCCRITPTSEFARVCYSCHFSIHPDFSLFLSTFRGGILVEAATKVLSVSIPWHELKEMVCWTSACVDMNHWNKIICWLFTKTSQFHLWFSLFLTRNVLAAVKTLKVVSVLCFIIHRLIFIQTWGLLSHRTEKQRGEGGRRNDVER